MLSELSLGTAVETSGISRTEAESLLARLVEIPSISGDELEASSYLVAAMRSLGYDRFEVDAAGNAVGELGPEDAARTVVLLGHIDTVYGDIPVRVEKREDGPATLWTGQCRCQRSASDFCNCSRPPGIGLGEPP